MKKGNNIFTPTLLFPHHFNTNFCYFRTNYFRIIGAEITNIGVEITITLKKKDLQYILFTIIKEYALQHIYYLLPIKILICSAPFVALLLHLFIHSTLSSERVDFSVSVHWIQYDINTCQKWIHVLIISGFLKTCWYVSDALNPNQIPIHKTLIRIWATLYDT